MILLFSFRIVSMLPHHLFFCNDPSEVTDMKQSFDVLQTCWVNSYYTIYRILDKLLLYAIFGESIKFSCRLAKMNVTYRYSNIQDIYIYFC